MPYSKTPVVQTYETKRINFISNPLQRSSDPNKDFRLLNMMTERVPSPSGDRYYVKSRPGLNTTFTTASGEGRGLYYWVVSGTGYAISVVGDKVFSNGTQVLTLTTSTGPVGFTEFVYSDSSDRLILVDGTKGYVFTDPSTPIEISVANLTAWQASTVYAVGDIRRPTTSNGYQYRVTVNGTSNSTEPTWPTTVDATVTDGGVTWMCEQSAFPSPHVPTPVFMDGYLFLAKAGTQDVYNSDLDTPLQWSAGSFLTAEMYPDRIVALAKNNNYIYAIGTNSIEYLYDAGNNFATIGTPLARQASAVQQFGCAAIGTVVQTEKQVLLVGKTGNGGYTVWQVDGFDAKEIGIPSVKFALLGEGLNLPNITAFCVRVSSQKLYVLCLSQRTLVYSFDTQMWSEWSTSDGTFIAENGSDGPGGEAYLQDKTNGKIYIMDETYFTDAGEHIDCVLTTARLDFDTINRKFMHRLTIIGDVPDATLLEDTVYISWSDDDYNTWSTERDLLFTADLPAIHQLGQFRRRALKLRYSSPHLLRIEALEVDINKGNV